MSSVTLPEMLGLVITQSEIDLSQGNRQRYGTADRDRATPQPLAYLPY
jgi:hypothetical protein